MGTAAAKMSSRGGDDDRRGGKHGGDNSFAAACAAPPAAPTDRADDDQASTSGAFIIHKVNKGDEKGLFEAPWPTKTMRLAEGQNPRDENWRKRESPSRLLLRAQPFLSRPRKVSRDRGVVNSSLTKVREG